MNELYSTGNSVVDEIGTMNFEGNVIPGIWFQTIQYPNSKPHLLAINILADIVYWYRPVDGEKRIKEDYLQRSYDSFATYFGVTKRQISNALGFLENIGVIKRHFRTITLGGVKVSNVLYIELIPKRLQTLTYPK
jgi:hypothetical protein